VKITRPISAILIASGILLAAGCDKPDAPTAAGTAKPRIAVIMKSLANEFFVTMEAGTREHHAAHADDYDLIINGIRDEAALAEQVALVEQMIATGVDVIVLAPADSKAMIPVVRRALAQGIVVINIDNRLDAAIIEDAGITVPFVGPVDREGAQAVGEYLGERLSAGDEVAIIGGISTAFNAQQRQLGFEDAMAAVGADIISVQDGNWHQAKASTIASALIAEYPNLKALLCSNDNMAIGAVAAVRQAGRTGQILVVGYDNISATHELLRNGEMLATAEQYGSQLAVYGIEFALLILNEGIVPEDRMTQVDLITAADL
jgi:ribose transport system substrate-binding protein